MAGERGFKKLIAWQRADELATLIFRAVQSLPRQHGWLGNQMARAAVSVPANIAEGYGRGTQGEYLRFLDIARGSLSEVEYYIHFTKKENLFSSETCQAMEDARAETGRVLYFLWQSLKAKSSGEWDHTGRVLRETPEFHYEALN